MTKLEKLSASLRNAMASTKQIVPVVGTWFEDVTFGQKNLTNFFVGKL